MKCLILSTLPLGDVTANEIKTNISKQGVDTQFIETNGLKISHCIGCNDCWIKTPGLCCIKDDYEQLLIKMLQVDTVVFLAETKYGFIHSQAKNLFDRILPLATMHLKYKEGQMRHFSRYDFVPDMALLYRGVADKQFLSHWLDRTTLNLHGKNIGVFSETEKEELCHALGDY